MKDNIGATKHHQRQGSINKLITPEMRREIRELKDQFDEHLVFVRGYCELLNNIRLAVFMARQSARCLLTIDPFQAWEKIGGQDEFDAFCGWPERKDTSLNHLAKANVERLITPQMRQQIIEAKQRLDDFVSHIGPFIDDLNKLKCIS